MNSDGGPPPLVNLFGTTYVPEVVLTCSQRQLENCERELREARRQEDSVPVSVSHREYFAAHADIEWEYARKCARLQFGSCPTNDQVLGMRATLAVGYADQLLKALRYG